MLLKFRFLLPLFCLPFFYSCAQGEAKKEETPRKMNGISFVASRDTIQQHHITPVLKIHTNYAAIMPFGFIKTLEHPEIIFNTDRQWFGETRNGAKQYIELLHKNNIKVLVKPQIWVWRGEFTGYLKMTSEENWKLLEDSYRNFILEYAAMAAEAEVDLFCIGTELEQFVMHRPAFWETLIAEIRLIYKGKLTYAANWDEYKRVPFWNKLDYIGVDAYFPISDQKTPTLEDAKAGWKPWKDELKLFSEKEQKQIIFTEYGYRSVDFAGKEPWVSDREMKDVNLEAQVNLTQGLFDEVWNESWFAGGFLWKWFIAHPEVGGINNSQFTPQNKPVEATITKMYGNN